MPHSAPERASRSGLIPRCIRTLAGLARLPAKDRRSQSLEDLREQQASALAYFDAFLVFTVVAVVLALLVPP